MVKNGDKMISTRLYNEVKDENKVLQKKLEIAKRALQEIAHPTRPIHYDLYQSVSIKGDDEIARDALNEIK